jgi:hypothetical protein
MYVCCHEQIAKIGHPSNHWVVYTHGKKSSLLKDSGILVKFKMFWKLLLEQMKHWV